VAVIGKLVAAAMPQHVAVNEEREPGSLARPGDHSASFNATTEFARLNAEAVPTARYDRLARAQQHSSHRPFLCVS
jgi:hypothetical protein